MTSTPRVLVNLIELPTHPRRGPAWAIDEADRQLDANLIRLPAGERIDSHLGAEVDVLIHVVSGDGTITTDDGEQHLRTGDVAFLPRRSRRAFDAGSEGLEYLTVHRRRQALQIQSGPPEAAPGS